MVVVAVVAVTRMRSRGVEATSRCPSEKGGRGGGYGRNSSQRADEMFGHGDDTLVRVMKQEKVVRFFFFFLN